MSLLEFVLSPEYDFALWCWVNQAPWQKEMPSLDKERRPHVLHYRRMDLNEVLK